MVRFIDQHPLTPQIDKVFPFEETPKAFEYLESAAHFGKVVIEL